MEIIEVRVRSKSLLSAFNIFVDVGGLVGDVSEAFGTGLQALRCVSRYFLFGLLLSLLDCTYVKAAFGGNKDLITSATFLKELAQQFLVVALAINDSRVPESAPEIHSLLQGDLGHIIVGRSVTLRKAHASV